MLDEHQYSIDLILFEAVPTFKLNTLLRKAHYEKSEGDPVTKTASIASTTAGFGRLPRGQKDAIYRLKNHPMVPWRAFFVDGYVAVLRRHDGNLRHTVDDRSVFPGDEAAFATRSVPISRFRCTNCARHDLLYFLYLSGQLSARQCLPTLRHAV